MNLAPSPRARSYSASVLGKDKDKGKHDRDEDWNDARNPLAKNVKNRALMERVFPRFNSLLPDKRWESQTTVTKLVPIFAMVLS